jgi:hypothetical protein
MLEVAENEKRGSIAKFLSETYARRWYIEERATSNDAELRQVV